MQSYHLQQCGLTLMELSWKSEIETNTVWLLLSVGSKTKEEEREK